jgi:hypothetical protein
MGAATPNPWTCHLLTHRDCILSASQEARREAPLGALPHDTATSHPRPPGSPQSGFLCFREMEFSSQRKAEIASPIDCEPNRMSFPQRRTLMKVKSDVVRWSDPNRFPQRSACSFEYGRPTRGTVSDEVGWSDTPHSITLWWLVRGCPTRVAGRTRTMFHNALVVDQVSESQENRAKQQSARQSG